MQLADLHSAHMLLSNAVQQRVFPGAAYSVVHGVTVRVAGVGQFTYDAASAHAQADTIYDVASLTKVLATTSIAMLLHERSALRLDTPLAEIVPEFVANSDDARRQTVTLRMLLAHSSGLPAYEKLFLRANGRDEMLRAAYSVPLSADPGTRAEYSDVGFILLGVALERLAREPLDTFCARELFGPLNMVDTMFRPPADLAPRIPPSEDDRDFRRRIICGEVNDENAWAMGGVAGHAGLFSTAEDIAKFATCMLHGGEPVFRRETVQLFTRRETTPPSTSRALGWDTPTQPSSSGTYLSSRAYGHLGFTGTSLWIDPERDLAVTLLTNRTWPHRGSPDAIKGLRPAFHDAVVTAVIKS